MLGLGTRARRACTARRPEPTPRGAEAAPHGLPLNEPPATEMMAPSHSITERHCFVSSRRTRRYSSPVGFSTHPPADATLKVCGCPLKRISASRNSPQNESAMAVKSDSDEPVRPTLIQIDREIVENDIFAQYSLPATDVRHQWPLSGGVEESASICNSPWGPASSIRSVDELASCW